MSLFLIPNNQFDAQKFKDRYNLTDEDFSVGPIGAQWYIDIRVELKEEPGFEPPAPPEEKDYAAEIVDKILPSGTAEEKANLAVMLQKMVKETR